MAPPTRLRRALIAQASKPSVDHLTPNAFHRTRNLPVTWRALHGPTSSRPGLAVWPSPGLFRVDRPAGDCMTPISAVPSAQGLYDPRFETDSCGVAFVADLHGRASHAIVSQALTALHNLDHRGAAGAEPSSGDGAGITVQIPDAFLRAVSGLDLPARGHYAVGIAFLPVEDEEAERVVAIVEE